MLRKIIYPESFIPSITFVIWKAEKNPEPSDDLKVGYPLAQWHIGRNRMNALRSVARTEC